MKKFLIFTILIFSSTFVARSQSGMTFAEFAKRLSPYFDRALILDIQKQLPQGSDYKIWGWDVGDYSGDGYNDVGFSIKLASEKKRIVESYLFVDIDGYLVKVGQFAYPYVDLPLEIGVVINNNTCMITKKNKQFNWEILGFSYDNGTLILHDEFTTRKLGSLTYETYCNFIDLRNNVKLIDTRKGVETFYRDFMTIPSYPRGRTIFKGFNNEVDAAYIDYVPSGAYYWEGKNDAGLKISSAYDDTYLYMTVEISDESIVIAQCDTCIADHIEVWIDATEPFPDGNRLYYINSEKIEFKTQADTGIYCFSVFPGDYKKQSAYVEISTNTDVTDVQMEASNHIKAITNLTENGYIVKFKIPFLFLGLEDIPVRNDKVFEMGCTVIAIDYDNEFRPEEFTKVATSAFDSKDPSTYGSIKFIPRDKWYGESQNIFTQDVINNLLEYGF